MKTGTWLHRARRRVREVLAIDQWERDKPVRSMPDLGTAPAENPLTPVKAVKRSGHWVLVHDGFSEEGTRVYEFMLGAKLIAQYYACRTEYNTIQWAIDSAPKTYTQPRKQKVATNE